MSWLPNLFVEIRLPPMTSRATVAIAIAGLLAACLGIALIHDVQQRRHFESLQQNIHSPQRNETKSTVIAKLGQPDATRFVSPAQNPKYGYDVDCRDWFYYRPAIRVLDEEYVVCFDGRGNAFHAEYLVSQ